MPVPACDMPVGDHTTISSTRKGQGKERRSVIDNPSVRHNPAAKFDTSLLALTVLMSASEASTPFWICSTSYGSSSIPLSLGPTGNTWSYPRGSWHPQAVSVSTRSDRTTELSLQPSPTSLCAPMLPKPFKLSHQFQFIMRARCS